jgi:hypothetical protein
MEQLSALLYTGNLQGCISKGESLTVNEEAQRVERDVFVYRAFILQNRAQIVVDEIPADSPHTALQAVRLLGRAALGADVQEELKALLGTSAANNPVLLVAAALIYDAAGKTEEAMRAAHQGTKVGVVFFVSALSSFFRSLVCAAQLAGGAGAVGAAVCAAPSPGRGGEGAAGDAGLGRGPSAVHSDGCPRGAGQRSGEEVLRGRGGAGGAGRAQRGRHAARRRPGRAVPPRRRPHRRGRGRPQGSSVIFFVFLPFLTSLERTRWRGIRPTRRCCTRRPRCWRTRASRSPPRGPCRRRGPRRRAPDSCLF